jgi:hypothetical protein
MKAPTTNEHDTREAWLRAGANALRPHFEDCKLPLPEKIRYAIAFTSTGRKSKRVGETWSATSSGDGSFEIFIRADLSDPLEILGVLVKELVHTALPTGAGHGKQFKDAATRIGLEGPMRNAKPGILLTPKLESIAASLGPLPHASLHIVDQSPLTAVAVALNRPKKQRARMLKAHCTVDDCTFLVRVAAQPVKDIGPPHCPRHGAMIVDLPHGDDDTIVA